MDLTAKKLPELGLDFLRKKAKTLSQSLESRKESFIPIKLRISIYMYIIYVTNMLYLMLLTYLNIICTIFFCNSSTQKLYLVSQ